jgi:L-alanine-DL-glutamate epimerase-like enolase superfamily enzyme
MLIHQLKLSAQIEKWPFVEPFRITGYVMDASEVLVVRLETDDHAVGLGEAAGVYYTNDRPAFMLKQIEALRPKIEAGLSRAALQILLPAGGARNALDCALWDLESKLSARPAWQIAQLEPPQPLLTTFTCGVDTPERMGARARSYMNARAIKLKLTGETIDSDRVRAVRAVRPDVWLGVDANQGFSCSSLESLMPTLVEAGVQLIEQPFPVGEDALLDSFESPIPVAADESAQGLADLARLIGRFNVVNIKLDKCGGLTEGLAMARAARTLGLGVMVGNTLGTSLAMAPAFLVGQLCQIVDLDGPVFLKSDRAVTVDYSNGTITCPESIWGGVHGADDGTA